MGIKLNVDLYGLTWGQLIEFVDAARAGGHGGDEPVAHITDPGDPDDRIVGLEVDVPTLEERVAVFDHVVRLQYAEALSNVLEEDGDARGQLGQLRDLRDGLLQ